MTTFKRAYLNEEFLKSVHQLAGELSFSRLSSLSDWKQLQSNFSDYFIHREELPLVYASPQTCVLVAKIGDELIGSISLIQNGIFSLPLESSISVQSISSQKNRLIEITDIVVRPGYPQKEQVRLLLLKYALLYISSATAVDRFIISDIFNSNGRMLDELGLGCLNKNFPKEYSLRKETQACFYYGSYNSVEHKLSKSSVFLKTKLFEFLTDTLSFNFDFPNTLFQRSNLIPMSPEAFRHFYPIERLRRLEQDEIRKLQNSFIQKPEYLGQLPDCFLPLMRSEVRHPVKCDAIQLDYKNSPVPSTEMTIVSVAKGGVGFYTGKEKYKKGSIISIRIEIGHNILSDIKVKVGSSYQGMTTGKIVDRDHYWGRYQQFLSF